MAKNTRYYLNDHGLVTYNELIKKKISELVGFDVSVLDELPTTGVEHILYLIPSKSEILENVRDEYLWVDEKWEMIGSTAVDLDNYYTKDEIDASLQNISVNALNNSIIVNNSSILVNSDTSYILLNANDNKISLNSSIITLTDASNGLTGLAIAEDVYLHLANTEEVMTTSIITIANKTGLDSSLNLVWSEESGLTEDTIKGAIEYVSMNAGVKIDDSSIRTDKTWSSSKINSEIEANTYILPTASTNKLGGIKVGENLSIDANGVLSASAPGATYTASSPLAIDNNNNISIDLSSYITKATADTLYNPKNTTIDNTTQSASSIKLPTWNENGQITGSKQVYEQLLNINNTDVHSVNDASTSAVSLYAPTTGGTAGQILISNGNTAAPSWQYLNVDATVIISDEDASLGNYSADIAAFYQASIALNKVQDVMIMIKEMHVDPSTAETTYSYSYYYPSAQRIYEGNVELWLLYTEDCVTWTNIYYLINNTVTRTVTTGTFGISNP